MSREARIRWFAALGVLGLGIGVVLLARRAPDGPGPGAVDETLEPLVESPRPPVRAGGAPPLLEARPAPPRAAAEPTDHAALVRERNDLARAHRLAVARYEQGMTSIEEVEQAEISLLDARHRLGEIDGPAWHRAREVLAARTVERTQARVEAGLTSPLDLRRARLSLEREKMLAGEAHAYDADREAYLAALGEWETALLEAGRVTQEAVREERAREEAAFPPAAAARTGDR